MSDIKSYLRSRWDWLEELYQIILHPLKQQLWIFYFIVI